VEPEGSLPNLRARHCPIRRRLLRKITFCSEMVGQQHHCHVVVFQHHYTASQPRRPRVVYCVFLYAAGPVMSEPRITDVGWIVKVGCLSGYVVVVVLRSLFFSFINRYMWATFVFCLQKRLNLI